MNLELIVISILLIILAVLDIISFNKKKGYIPAVFSTSFLIIAFLIGDFPAVVFSGVVSLLFSLWLADMDMIQGVADIKVLTACGMTFAGFNVLNFILVAIAMTLCFQLFAKYKTKWKQIPMIPAIMLAYFVSLPFFA